jgi:hypothetical protein
VLITSKQRAAREKKMAEKEDLAMQASDNVSAEPPERIAAAGDEVLAGQLSSVSQPTMEAVRILDHPSSKTTYEKILPACQLLFSRACSTDVLNDTTTEMVNVCADFAKSKGFSCMGVVLWVMQHEELRIDPFGGVLWDLKAKSFKLPMAQSVNKVTRQLEGPDGSAFTREAPYALAKAMLAGNVARHMLENPEVWAFVSDGAAENCGQGGDHARENFCGPGGVFWQVMLTREIWPEVRKGAERAGLLDALDEFFGNRDFKWIDEQAVETVRASADAEVRASEIEDSAPSAAADGGSAAADSASEPHCPRKLEEPLDTAGPVHKDPNTFRELCLRYTAETQKAKDDQRKRTLADLESRVEAGPDQSFLRLYGPTRDEADKTKLDERLKKLQSHKDEFQRRMHRSRAKALDPWRKSRGDHRIIVTLSDLMNNRCARQ